MRVCLSNHHASKSLSDFFNIVFLQMSSFEKWVERFIAFESSVILFKHQINTTNSALKATFICAFTTWKQLSAESIEWCLWKDHWIFRDDCSRSRNISSIAKLVSYLHILREQKVNETRTLNLKDDCRVQKTWSKKLVVCWLLECNLKQSQIEFLISCRIRRDLLSERWKAFSYLELWLYSSIEFHKKREERISNSSRLFLKFLLSFAKSTCRLMFVSYWKRRDMQGISWELAVGSRS